GTSRSFFFQAEDGIRDLTVTEVQTCALPISRPLDRKQQRSSLSRRRLLIGGAGAIGAASIASKHRHLISQASAEGGAAEMIETRSEERRVGKEWRCRGGPGH